MGILKRESLACIFRFTDYSRCAGGDLMMKELFTEIFGVLFLGAWAFLAGMARARSNGNEKDKGEYK